jgi:hypothetical protein
LIVGRDGPNGTIEQKSRQRSGIAKGAMRNNYDVWLGGF